MSGSSIDRWLYRGQHPNGVARMLNRTWGFLASSGVTARLGMVTLEVTGRTSGRTIAFPVVVVTVNGQRYLVSMLGNDVQWVKNVRAAGGRAVLRSGTREPILLEEIPVDQRALILKAYLERAPGARAHIPVDRRAPLSDFERIADAYPVFRLASLGHYRAKSA